MIPGPSDGDGQRGGDDRNACRFRDADRGQLLLISGLVVAVSLVALVVLLNASIYSENVATRGVEAADGEALEVRAAAVEETGALIDGTNRNRPADHAAAATAVEDGIGELDAHLARAYADRGGVTHVSGNASSVDNGSYVTGALTPNGTGNANATVAADAARLRGVEVEVDPGSLASTDATGAPANAFRVEFANATGATREAYVYESDADGNVTVAVGENGTAPTVVCSAATADRVAVDLTAGTLGDERCPGLWAVTAGSLAGSYDATIERTTAADGEVTATALPDAGASVGSDLRATPAVYSARIDLRYRTAELRFETAVRVAPGEPDA